MPDGGQTEKTIVSIRPEPSLAPVIGLSSRRPRRDHEDSRSLRVIPQVVSIVVAISALMSGYYDFNIWGPLALGAVAMLVILVFVSRPMLTRHGISAAAALVGLLLLSFASMLWAESRDAAWTDSNRLALYVVLFGIALIAIREQRSARSALLILGTPALLTSLIVAVEMLTGGGRGAFLEGRLDSPIGYINGTAALLVMGLWPWFSLAETAASRVVRSFAFAGASIISATAVLTQSRAIVPALLVATFFVLLVAPHRVRRGTHLLLLLGAVAGSLPWTLRIYRSTGPAQALPVPSHDLKVAGLGILLSGTIGLFGHLILDAGTVLVPASARGRVRRTVGGLLICTTLAGAGWGVAAQRSRISQQWHDFTSLRVNQAAPNRFLDAGGFRYDLWRVAVDEFRLQPISGVGAGNYDSEYYQLRRNPQSVIQPHSLELQMAAELGLLGLVSLLVFCISIVLAGFRRTGTMAATDPMVRVAAVGIFTSWLTATSVDWLYDIPGLSAMALIAAAALVVRAPTATVTDVGKAFRLPRVNTLRRGRLAVLLGLLGLAAIAASIGRQYGAARYAASGAAELERHPIEAIHTLETAESLDPYALSTLYSIASSYARLDDYHDARTALLAAAREEPTNFVPPALLGDLAIRVGDRELALREYLLALRLNPREPALIAAVQAAERHGAR